jgi:hypothetical protein
VKPKWDSNAFSDNYIIKGVSLREPRSLRSTQLFTEGGGVIHNLRDGAWTGGDGGSRRGVAMSTVAYSGITGSWRSVYDADVDGRAPRATVVHEEYTQYTSNTC